MRALYAAVNRRRFGWARTSGSGVEDGGNGIYQTNYYYQYLDDELKELSKGDSLFNWGKFIEGWEAGIADQWEEIKGQL